MKEAKNKRKAGNALIENSGKEANVKEAKNKKKSRDIEIESQSQLMLQLSDLSLFESILHDLGEFLVHCSMVLGAIFA